MFSEIALELLFIVVLLLINGVFAMSEIAVVTSRKIRLEQRAETGDKGAAAALALAHEPTQFLSTVQVGITLVGVLAGAFGGATLAEEIAGMLATVPALVRYAETLSLAIVVGGITYLSLIIGELVPKRIALGAPERIASFIARPMRALSRVTAPLVRVLTGSTNLMLRLLGVRPHSEPGITEEEIRAALQQGAESGAVPRAEQALVESVFQLGDRNVRSIMTPRIEVEWIDLAGQVATSSELTSQLIDDRRAQWLVCDDDLDHVVGFVNVEDLLATCLHGAQVTADTLRSVAQPPLFVPFAMPVLQLVETFRTSRQHSAVVLDEYGGVDGVVELHDVMEALVGELPEVGDVEEPSIVKREDGTWLVEGALALPELEMRLGLDLRSGERAEYETLAGFVLAQLERLPKPGDSFEWHHYRFEVIDLDGRRVDKVLITPPGHG